MRHPSGLIPLLLGSFVAVTAFHLPLTKTHSKSTSSQPIPFVRARSSSLEPLYFWGNNKKEDDSDEGDSEDKSPGGLMGGLLPFFANKEEDKKTEEVKEKKEPAVVAAAAVVTPPVEAKGPASRRPKPTIVEETDPVKRAEGLRAQAERARLEAEKMDAELTLKKITRLEKEMATAVAKDKTDDVERLQREMDALQAKIRGEVPPPVVIPRKQPKVEDKPKIESSTGTTPTITTSVFTPDNSIQMPILKQVNEQDFEQVIETLEKSPNFIKKLLAQMTEVDFIGADDINITEVTKRMIQLQNFDYSYSSRTKPSFTQDQIDTAIKEKLIAQSNVEMDNLPEGVKGNATAEALLALEYNFYVDAYDMSKMNQLLDGEDWLKGVIDAVNTTEVDSSIEIFYPKCTRKEDAPLPTMAQVQMLMSDVLPKASFTPRGQPEQVLGGFIVRGTSKFDSGDETITAIDEQLEKAAMLKDKMTVLYTKDFTILAEGREDGFAEMPNPDDEPPILYIMGPDIVPERRRFALSITTAFGIATSWYLSVYPFLLNPTLMKRTEEQIQMADAGMTYDLSWLSQLSLPLFITFIGIQLAHEAGHKVAGAANGVSTTFPTFVPSLITGVTSTVTQFKEPPKNKEALFDVAVAGPLAGIAASLAALVVGSQLTLISDPSVLPALPLDILRQSTLGGGIIDGILGGGALSVPYGAEASQAVAGMTVTLHPVAVAGYIGLILNGLALLPIGTTDGGRIALALFGRGVKSFIGNVFLFTIFLVGVLGSDLFLFYFSFLIAFQTGNEIPARNEVDNISFSRVLLATGTTVLALLTLIPFQ